MKIILYSLFCFSNYFCFAANYIPLSLEDTLSAKQYKISQKEFLQKFARDDTSRALILFYFHRRGAGIGKFFAGFPIAAFSGVVLNVVRQEMNNYFPGGPDNLSDDPPVVLGAILFFCLGIALFSTGIEVWSRYSRKSLLKLLNNYFGGKSIPRHIAQSKIFREYLHDDRNISR